MPGGILIVESIGQTIDNMKLVYSSIYIDVLWFIFIKILT